MGNSCFACGDSKAAAPKAISNKQLLEAQQNANRICNTIQDDNHDLVYPAITYQQCQGSSRMMIRRNEDNQTKRTSEPSLLRLNNDLTNLINSFEKLHGTIDATRSHSLVKKSVVVNEEPIQIKEEVDDNSMKSASANDSYASSSKDEGTVNIDMSKYLLDDELVDNNVEIQRRQLLTRCEMIENRRLPIWQHIVNTPIKLSIQQLSFQDRVFYASVASIIFYSDLFGITLVSLYQTQTTQVKVWINGTKRSLSVSSNSLTADIFQTALHQLYGMSNVVKNPCQEVYHLSGWCPECLSMEEISNKDNLWERLTQNFNEGNILISFGYTMCGVQHYLTLKTVDRVNGTLEILCPEKPPLDNIAIVQGTVYRVSWTDLSPFVQKIYINWNPQIYTFCKKIDSFWKTDFDHPMSNENICLSNNPQFLLRIPKHHEDFQIRVFVERHISSFGDNQTVAIKLFEYDGVRIMDPRNPIRSLDNSKRQLLSDVFIFEKSEEEDYFVLALIGGDNESRNISYSIVFLSFLDIEVSRLPFRQVLLTKSISSPVRVANFGMGINSPNFTSNLHYGLTVPLDSDFQVLVQGYPEMQFSLILLEDRQKTADLLQIDFEQVLNSSNGDPLFKQYGFLQHCSKTECYILVIGCYCTNAQPSPITVTVNIVSKLKKRNREVQQCYPPIKIEQLLCNPNIIHTQTVKWQKEHTGQRRRLKATTTPIYHPISVFAQFLKNPTVQLRLNSGRYQFNITSQDYRNQFMSLDCYDRSDGNLEPPALSLAVLRLSDNTKGYKIILDDAYYVPLGFGFWTECVSLEAGTYTIVCPRINKEVGRGILRIRQL